MEKQIHNMTNEEILRQQLVLLAEASRGAMDMELGPLSTAMVEVCKLLSAPTKTTMSPGCLLYTSWRKSVWRAGCWRRRF